MQAGKRLQPFKIRKERKNTKMNEIIRITDLNTPQLDIYARLNEPQLLHINDPRPGIFIAESPNVIARGLDAGYEPISFLMEEKHITGEGAFVIAKAPNVPIFTASADILTGITGFALTRGMLCAMRRKALPTAGELCANARRIAVLEKVVNPTNVGAIIRSAAALHIDAVLLTRDCSDPLYRRALRVGMGCAFQIPWTFIETAKDGGIDFSHLHDLHFKTAAMALSDNSVSIDHPSLLKEEKLAIVLGSEGYGLTEATIHRCDYTVKIPMAPGVDSLNVAAASAVAFWQLR